MAISFISEGVHRPKLKYRDVIFWLKQIILSYNGVSGELTYIFCDDQYLLDINNRFLNHDYFTDIITFDYCINRNISGDIFISIERVAENSSLYKVTFEEEILRVIAHGLLHLIGFTDESPEQRQIMRDLENDCIFKFKKIENGHFK